MEMATERLEDLPNGDLLGRLGEPVAPTRPPKALDQTRAAQQLHELPRVVDAEALRSSNLIQRQGVGAAMPRRLQ